MFRHEVRPFDDAELKALASFAEQASLAIANANLFNDLDAALERQTAMTDVLEAVGTARIDVQPVFDRIVEHAQRLCDDTVLPSLSGRDRCAHDASCPAGAHERRDADPDAPTDRTRSPCDRRRHRRPGRHAPASRSHPGLERGPPMTIPTPGRDSGAGTLLAPDACGAGQWSA